MINTLIKNKEFAVERLILIVHEHSVLYDKRNTNYKNIVLKEALTQYLTKQEAVKQHRTFIV